MKFPAQSKARLHELMESRALPASQCGQAFRKLLAPLLDSGALEWKRSGAGRQLVVSDIGALSDFCRQRFPEAMLPADVGNRIAGVALFRDTKAMVNSENEIICLRAWRDDVLLKDGKPVDAAVATHAHGIFSFLLTPESRYQLRGPCALVENPAVFAVAEKLDLDFGAVIYGHGRISSRLLNWLAGMADPTFSLLHLPDYDPVGLSEFQRLQARLGKRVVLHLPADLEARFAQFSNGELLGNASIQGLLAQLRRSDSPAICHVVELIDLHNAGLEQEALLIKLHA